MLATHAGAVPNMDEDNTSRIAGWLAGLFGVLLALVAGVREFFKNRHERALKADSAAEKQFDSMLARITALETREEKERKEATQREDTLRTRVDAVEKEAEDCQKSHLVLKEQHRVVLSEVSDLREENDTLREEVGVLRRQNVALHDELQMLYKQIGVKRTAPPMIITETSGPKKKS
jgi:flagellar biosynthesis/type III secretory pathway M-ring protein FliF/YscJ